ncbi:uncharacterized protein LOC127751984 isoform X1 [Frankliniella occidentalis]|uniref:Uncharacterized protein LOC127751984 isoform X1 n=1 Tax=Frankliniella occidentalis TaxID=133901 RepID=A0A9C6XAP1_FRAOC|nr:uncharacterized protein LOC127751984 isoform X1 [Frankliniella occidentalis]
MSPSALGYNEQGSGAERRARVRTECLGRSLGGEVLDVSLYSTPPPRLVAPPTRHTVLGGAADRTGYRLCAAGGAGAGRRVLAVRAPLLQRPQQAGPPRGPRAQRAAARVLRKQPLLHLHAAPARLRNPNDTWWEELYILFSFGFLVVRASAVSLFAASVHENSRSVQDVLYCVCSEDYNEEVYRFLVQVTSDDVALSGCSMFKVTRGLLLTLAGTILTYEVVLVQLH